MQPIGRIIVFPTLPPRIARLRELADNIYWSWTPEAQALFEFIDARGFEATNRNPVRTLLGAAQADLDRAAASPAFQQDYDRAMAAYDAYMARTDTWYAREQPADLGTIAYFSMEFAFHESLQIYSGGLGVLAGDHCKSASDLGLPFVAVGLMFHHGYFYQRINADGWQEEAYERIDPQLTPLRPALDTAGKELRVWIELPGRSVCARVWRLAVGRVNVYLMDTDLPENRPEDRDITARLYGGNQEMRVQQELVLGAGGVRALRAMGLRPSAFHMNEGHAAFLGLERARELVQDQGLAFPEAVEATAAGGIFTTHTPVPAGNDAFGFELVDRMLGHYWYGALRVGRDEFLELGRHDQPWGPTFSMTVLALRLSRFHNGVSELHGEVSRRMWSFLWPGARPEEVPIRHVTNGIHTRTFLAPSLAALYDRFLPADWNERIEQPKVWSGIDEIPDDELWQARSGLKRDLIRFVRARVRRQLVRHEAPAAQVAATDQLLREDALTIGFARRFATYKRATLLFRDLERLRRILANDARPVQFIFAGKAHPADNPGKELIQAIHRLSREPGLAGKVVMLEDYDMNVARHLVRGCDMWLNNPRRPLEASGTSGEKASLNGGLNFSVLDGWWREAHDGTNGWAIGEDREYQNLGAQDEADAFSMYETLENQILPLYFATEDRGGRSAWLERVRDAIKTIAPAYSTQRMVQDYTRLLYTPARRRHASLTADSNGPARALAAWKSSVRAAWPGLRVEASLDLESKLAPGGRLPASARVFLGGVPADAVRVEAVVARAGEGDAAVTRLEPAAAPVDGWLAFEGGALVPEAGAFEVGVRAIPFREDLSYPLEVGLIRWGGQAIIPEPEPLAAAGT